MIIIAKGREIEKQHMVGHTVLLWDIHSIHTALYCAVAWKASLHTPMESADVKAGGLNAS